MSAAEQKRLERILILRTIINAGGHLDAKSIADRANSECDHDALDGLPTISRRGIGQKLQAMGLAGLVTASQDVKFDPFQWYVTETGKRLAFSLDDGDLIAAGRTPSRSRAAIDQIIQQPQRQDGLDNQLRDVATAANRLGCYDAADWIRAAL